MPHSVGCCAIICQPPSPHSAYLQ